MHSFWHRLNTSLTFFGTVAAVLCILTTSTDLFHKSDPKVKVGIRDVQRLVPHRGNKDHAVLTFDLEADLRSVFSWNTKQLFVYLQAEYATDDNPVNQVVLWDNIVQQKEKAVYKLKGHKTKYSFIDRGNNLRGRELNLTLVWCAMPRVGYMASQQRTFAAGRLPASYS